MRSFVPLAAALALAGCGGDATKSAAPAEWQEARIAGLESASGVAAWRDFLLFTSSTGKSLYFVRRDDAKDGATLAARAIPLEVDGERETFFSRPEGLHSFRLKEVWEGEPRFSGLCVAAPDILYVVSEAYRLVWFGPLEVGPDGAPARCRFERAAEAPGAHRTKASASDWHDYGPGDADDGSAPDGVSGLTAAGDDVVAIERARGAPQALAFRLDRMAGTAGDATRLPFAAADPVGTRWWSDVTRAERGFLAAWVRAPAGGPPETRIVRFARVNSSDLAGDGPPMETLFTVPAPEGGGWYEGLAVSDRRLWLVSGGGTRERPTRLRWRAHP